MRRILRRLGIVAGCSAVGGVLLAGPGSGCLPFVGELAFQTADLCFIFDCQNGILGGAIDPCPDAARNAALNGEAATSPATGPLFVDCP